MLISDKVFKVFVDVERCKFRQEQLITYKKFSRETTQTLLSYLHRKARSYVFSCNGYHFLQIRIQLFSSMRIWIQLKQFCETYLMKSFMVMKKTNKIAQKYKKTRSWSKFAVLIVIKCQLLRISLHFSMLFFLKIFSPESGSTALFCSLRMSAARSL